MSGNYSELKRAESLIKETLKMEEEKFLVLLDRGIKILNDEISKIDKVLPGDVAFKLYDTYGFPLDLTEDILRNKSLSIDTKKFQSLMKESRELAKKNWKGSGDSAVENIWFGVRDKVGATEFLGYETDQAEGVILSLLKDNKEVKELKLNDEGMVITNQTPFYGESGGQVGDTGEIIYGDSVASLEKLDQKIDLFINDSDHSANYEYREYQTIKNKLNPKALILGDNSHVTDKLLKFSIENDRMFVLFKEEPKDHWYPGAGVGISFPRLK